MVGVNFVVQCLFGDIEGDNRKLFVCVIEGKVVITECLITGDDRYIRYTLKCDLNYYDCTCTDTVFNLLVFPEYTNFICYCCRLW